MSEPADRFTKDHVPGLDALRGLAVLLILWTHVPPAILGTPIDLLKGVVQPGYLGVDLFFVLSGFLITRILLVDKDRGRPLRWFLLRRVLRIFPIYYLVVAAVWLIRPGPELPWCALYASNFYFPFHPQETMLRHSWSLAVEEHFYLLWPLAVYLLPTRKAAFAAVGLLPFAVACAIAAILLAGATGLHWIASTFGESAAGSYSPRELIYMGTMFRAESLGLGALLAFSERRIERRPWTAQGLALGAGVAAAVLVRASSLDVAARWVPLTRLIGFTGVSGAAVLWLIGAHYAGKSGAWREWLAIRLAPTARNVGLALLVHGVLEVALLGGLRWLAAGTSLPLLAVGLLIVCTSLVGLVACASFWVGASLRRLREKMAAASVGASILGIALAAALASIATFLGPRFRTVVPSVVLPMFLGVTALLLLITSLQRTSAALASRASKGILVVAAVLVVAFTTFLSARFAAPDWLALDALASGQFAIAAALYLVVLLFALRVSHAVGRISYGLYLYHAPVYVLVGLRASDPSLPRLELLAIAVLASLTLAALSYRYLESPILRWAQRFR
jgi:peptidoglycan/LPS O-acetylase OafA/YrhL